MHPVLNLDEHPICRDVILALHKCHRERSWAKFLGACNEHKYNLDKCLAYEWQQTKKKEQEELRRSYQEFFAYIVEREKSKS